MMLQRLIVQLSVYNLFIGGGQTEKKIKILAVAVAYDGWSPKRRSKYSDLPR